MIRLNIHEVKAQLSKCIEMVESGQTVVVCKRNVAVAEIRPIDAKKKRLPPELGWAKGLVEILPSFHEPMSEEELRLWEEGHHDDPLRKLAPKAKARKRSR